jgi:preprotein translocase SecE subunit
MGIINYFKETKAEAKHIHWPTRKETINITIAVIVLAVVLATLLGLFDFAFTKGLQALLP